MKTKTYYGFAMVSLAIVASGCGRTTASDDFNFEPTVSQTTSIQTTQVTPVPTQTLPTQQVTVTLPPQQIPAGTFEPPPAGVKVTSSNTVAQPQITALDPGTPQTRSNAPQQTATAQTIPQSSGKTHTVKPGETLIGIARLYGVRVSSLTALNGIGDKDFIKADQELSIPVG